MPISKDPEKREKQLRNLSTGKKFESGEERARNAQKKSVEVRERKRAAAERLSLWYFSTARDKSGKAMESVLNPGEDMLNGEHLDAAKLKLAREGNLEAIKYIEKQIGVAPDEQLAVSLNGGVRVEQDYNFFNLDDYEDNEGK